MPDPDRNNINLADQDTRYLLTVLHGLVVAINETQTDLANAAHELAGYSARTNEIQMLLQRRLLQFKQESPK